MSTKIKGSEFPLAKIFSSDFDYNIPSFQRPYSWTEDQTRELFNDLHDFYVEESSEEQYFLGSIVLVKEDDKPHSEVIDGQQRLTTLTILLAALTSRLTGDDRADFKNYIIEPGRASQGIVPKPRLQLRKVDNPFFCTYVQEMQFDKLFGLNPDMLPTEAQQNILLIAKLLMDLLVANFASEAELVRFGAFLVQRCLLIVVSTPTEQSAFRIFSVMNNRGMDLLVTDIIKADVIGAITPDSWQQDYNEKWESLEIQLGRSGFNDLFGHIRMIRMKAKAKKSLQEEFYKFVLPAITCPIAIDFIDNTLEPFANAYDIISSSHYAGAEDVNNILRWLNRIDNSDWLPVAMLYYVKHKDNAVLLQRFFSKLERLAAYMRISSTDVTHRIDRYAKVLADLENPAVADFGPSIELSAAEIQDFLTRLGSDVYKMTSNKRNYLVLRLDSFVSDGSAYYDSKLLTIEHVLPQTVAPGSQWEKDWPDPVEREKWLHKLGNILPLSKRKNSQAQNYEFPVKKEKYFKTKGVSSFALTTQVLNYTTWTPAIVQKRQSELIEICKKKWDLIL